MRGMKRLWKTVRLAFVCGCVFAGAAPRLAADLAADLARISVEAEGGAKAHAALRSFRASGFTRLGDKKVDFFLYAARPRCVRVETLGEKGSLVRAFDGVYAPWKKDDPVRPPRRLGQAEEKDFILDADFDNPLYDYRARQISLDYAGETTIDGKVYQKLLATVRFTDVLTLYLDDETHLLVRRDQTKRVGGRTAVVETHYSDFKKVAGVKLPCRIRIEIEGHLLDETVIENYEVNPTLPADFFSPPAKDWPKL